MHTHTHTCMCLLHTYVCLLTYSGAWMRILVPCSDVYTCEHTHTHTHTHKHMYAHIHVHAHRHTHIHTHTHYALSLNKWFSTQYSDFALVQTYSVTSIKAKFIFCIFYIYLFFLGGGAGSCCQQDNGCIQIGSGYAQNFAWQRTKAQLSKQPQWPENVETLDCCEGGLYVTSYTCAVLMLQVSLHVQ